MTNKEEILDDFDREVENYNEHYLKTTKQDEDPKELVGPGDSFEEMADWQYNLLISHGLKTGDTVIDMGCGVLRAGIPLIKYLEKGNYIGADISLRALLEGHRRLHEQKLGNKEPVIIQNEDLSFNELKNYKADYLVMQSLWTHLPPNKLKQCVENMGKVLHDESQVFVTLYSSPDIDEPVSTENMVDWVYPVKHIQVLLEENGYSLKHLEDAEHPNGLVTLKVTKKSE